MRQATESALSPLVPDDSRLGALSAAVAKLVSGHGRSPTQVSSWHLDDTCVVTALEDFATPAEQALMESGHARLVRQMRAAFGQAIREDYLLAAQEALGRDVVAHRSQLICASGICIEVFLLADECGEPAPA